MEGQDAEVRALVGVCGANVNLEAWVVDTLAYKQKRRCMTVTKDSAVWKTRRTPLIAAARNNHADVVQTLIELGADVNQRKSTDGETALFVGSHAGHVETVRVLLEHGAAVNQPSDSGCTPLQAGVREGHTEVVRLLLTKGAAVNQAWVRCSVLNRKYPLDCWG
jgi:ankyrin repeat protein